MHIETDGDWLKDCLKASLTGAWRIEMKIDVGRNSNEDRCIDIEKWRWICRKAEMIIDANKYDNEDKYIERQ